MARGPRVPPRLIVAGLLAAAADLAALGLLATATWLLVSAAGQPPLAALTVAIVSVRALAIGRGTLRYAERLTGHDAVLRILAAVRQRLFAAGGGGPGLTAARPGSGARSGTGAAGEDQTGVPGPASGTCSAGWSPMWRRCRISCCGCWCRWRPPPRWRSRR